MRHKRHLIDHLIAAWSLFLCLLLLSSTASRSRATTPAVAALM